MFDFGAWGEFLIIAIAALILLGPKDIPKALKIIGQWIYKARTIVQSVKGYVDELAFQAQREEIMKLSKNEEEPASDDKHG